MKKLVLSLFIIVLVFASSSTVHAESESDDSFNSVEATEEQIRENQAVIEEKEAILREAGLLIETSDFITLQHYSDSDILASSYYTNKKLGVKRVEQDNSYYCGPAATKMVLDYKGIVKSQSTIASNLGTTQSDGTGIYNISAYLKSQTGFSYVTQNINNRSVENVKITIDADYPVIYNVMTGDLEDDYTFNSGHYITGHGYRLYTDPNISPSSPVASQSSVSTQSTVYSVVTDLYYFDPWYGDNAVGEKMISVSKLTSAIKASKGLYVW